MSIYLLYMASPVWMMFIVELLFRKSVSKSTRAKQIYLTLFAILMTLMIGLRHYDVGSRDSFFYFTNWETMSSIPAAKLFSHIKQTDLEYGYQIVVWLFSQILPRGQWLFMLSGAFFSYCVCSFVYKNCKNVVLALLVFNCLGIFNFMVQGLRQSIAMCICLLSLERIKKHEYWQFFLYVVLACLFHASSAVFLIVPVLCNFKFSYKSVFLFLLCVTVGIVILPTVFSLLNIILNDNYNSNSAADSGGGVAILIYACVLLFGIVYRDQSSSDFALFFYMTAVAGILMVLRNAYSGIAERVSYFFAFAEMAVISNCVYSIKKSNQRLIVSGVIAVLCFGVAIHKAGYSVLVPYYFFWQ